jgi:alanine racemase
VPGKREKQFESRKGRHRRYDTDSGTGDRAYSSVLIDPVIIGTVNAPRLDRSPAVTSSNWAEVSLDALRQNFRAVRKHVGERVGICAVVKADAYGHGAAACAQALESEGAPWFGVTGTEEAMALRQAGIKARLLLMTGIWKGEEDEVVANRLTPVVWEKWHVERLESAAAKKQTVLPIHLKIDTGMTRLGVSREALPAVCAAISSSPHLSLEGVSTHFATVRDPEKTRDQSALFEEALTVLVANKLEPALIHMANSAAILSRPESWKTMIRPGIALYGYSRVRGTNAAPSADVVSPLRPVLAWKTRMIALKEVAAGQAVGYGGTFVTQQPSRIAVLPVGYADGFHRLLSNRGRVIVRGEYAPVVGRVSMDLTTVDVTSIPGIEIGDEVILIGASNNKIIDASEHARICETIPYEILCSISKRVPRVYVGS